MPRDGMPHDRMHRDPVRYASKGHDAVLLDVALPETVARDALPAGAMADDASRADAPAHDRRAAVPAMQTVLRLHLFSRWLLERGMSPAARLVEAVIRIAYGARIPAAARLDPTVRLGHDGLALAIADGARIGARCVIASHVLIGTRSAPGGGAPVIEEDVVVHAGARIVGPVRIGRGAVIGANAVVLTDIPPHALAMGAPATPRESALASETYLPAPREAGPA